MTAPRVEKCALPKMFTAVKDVLANAGLEGPRLASVTVSVCRAIRALRKPAGKVLARAWWCKPFRDQLSDYRCRRNADDRCFPCTEHHVEVRAVQRAKEG